MTLGLKSLLNHPVINELMKSVPTSINTDDPFIFNVMLSDEYWKVASTLNWNVEELIDYMEGVEDQILDSSKQSNSIIAGGIPQFTLVFDCIQLFLTVFNPCTW